MTVLTFPTLTRGPATVEFWPQSNTQSHVSPLDGSTQTRELPGPVWRSVLPFPPLKPADWRVLSAFLAQLRGGAGRFHYGPTHASAPRGTATAADVDGAGQTGSSLDLKNMGAGKTLLTGDYFHFDTTAGRELKIVTADVTADGTGAGTVSFEPPIRTSPADSAALTIAGATAVMRLVDDDQGRALYRPPDIGAFHIEIVESFT